LRVNEINNSAEKFLSTPSLKTIQLLHLENACLYSSVLQTITNSIIIMLRSTARFRGCTDHHHHDSAHHWPLSAGCPGSLLIDVPGHCSFDTLGDLCGYSNLNTTDLDWRQLNGPSTTLYTGPPTDHSGTGECMI